MNDPELKEIVISAGRQKGFIPNADTVRQWKAVFGLADIRDLRQAVEDWYRTHNEFPMPNDIKARVTQLAMARSRQNASPRRTVLWECPRCGHRMVAFTTDHPQDVRLCQTSYGPMMSGTMLRRHETCGGILNSQELVASE